MSLNDIQEVTINVIKTLKEQGLLRTNNQKSVRASAASHYGNVSSVAILSTRHSYNKDNVHFRPVDVASGVLHDLTGESHSFYSEASASRSMSTCIYKEKSIVRTVSAPIREKIVNNECLKVNLANIGPKDYPLLGIKCNHRYYYDMCLPMGCSCSCHII